MLTTRVEGEQLLLVVVFAYSCRKYDSDGKVLDKWSGDDAGGKRKEKEEASELFKGFWRRCIADENYQALKKEWQKEKKAAQSKSDK